MARHRRIIRPGDIVHVISRFVNDEFRFTTPEERDEYLRRFGERILASDWDVFSYALMSSHLHHLMVAGLEPFERLIKSVHAPFAAWLNERQDRTGPVFAQRPKTLVLHPSEGRRLIAYHHNNPPRGGVVERAADCDWTSHQAYVDATQRPDWLDVCGGYVLLGLDDTPAGRQAFEVAVDATRDQPRDPMLSGDPREKRKALREELGAAVCVAHPTLGEHGLEYDVRHVHRWSGTLEDLFVLVEAATGIPRSTTTGRSRVRKIVSARRVFAAAARCLGFSNRAVGLAVGVSEAAVRKQLEYLSERERETIRWVLAGAELKERAAKVQ